MMLVQTLFKAGGIRECKLCKLEFKLELIELKLKFKPDETVRLNF